ELAQARLDRAAVEALHFGPDAHRKSVRREAGDGVDAALAGQQRAPGGRRIGAQRRDHPDAGDQHAALQRRVARRRHAPPAARRARTTALQKVSTVNRNGTSSTRSPRTIAAGGTSSSTSRKRASPASVSTPSAWNSSSLNSPRASSRI